jgi:hypothetical protein
VLTRHLVRLIDLFREHRIEALPFKGPTLSASLYDDPGLREFADIDVLVRRDAIPLVRTLMAANGYKLSMPAGARSAASYLRCRHELSFVAADGSLVEIHQCFLAPCYALLLENETLWRRLDRITLFGREMLSLHHADLLLVLCAHGMKHCWSQLRWICDIAMLIVKYRAADWPEENEEPRGSFSLDSIWRTECLGRCRPTKPYGWRSGIGMLSGWLKQSRRSH